MIHGVGFFTNETCRVIWRYDLCLQTMWYWYYSELLSTGNKYWNVGNPIFTYRLIFVGLVYISLQANMQEQLPLTYLNVSTSPSAHKELYCHSCHTQLYTEIVQMVNPLQPNMELQTTDHDWFGLSVAKDVQSLIEISMAIKWTLKNILS